MFIFIDISLYFSKNKHCSASDSYTAKRSYLAVDHEGVKKIIMVLLGWISVSVLNVQRSHSVLQSSVRHIWMSFGLLSVMRLSVGLSSCLTSLATSKTGCGLLRNIQSLKQSHTQTHINL